MHFKCNIYKSIFKVYFTGVNITTFRHNFSFLLPVGFIFFDWKFIERKKLLFLSFNINWALVSAFSQVCVHVCTGRNSSNLFVILTRTGARNFRRSSGWRNKNYGFIVKPRVCFRLQGSFCDIELTCLK